jgi:hypothetical protein
MGMIAPLLPGVNFLYVGSFFTFAEKGSAAPILRNPAAQAGVYTQNTIGLNFEF